MLDVLLANLGPEILRRIGNAVGAQIATRIETAQTCRIEAPSLIICDHEFVAFAYFLATSHCAFTAAINSQGEIEQPAPAKPEAFVQAVERLGQLNFQGCMVVSEGRAMAAMKEMAEAAAAADRN